MVYRQNENKVQYLEEYLQHHGVKGMKWGVRRSPAQLARAAKRRAKDELKSAKRERSWKDEAKNVNKMPDAEIRRLTDRIRNENSLKRMAARKEYLSRSELSDSEIKKRVERLNLEAQLNRNVEQATRWQKDLGEEMTSLAVNATIAGSTGGTTAAAEVVKTAVQSAARRSASSQIRKRTGVNIG